MADNTRKRRRVSPVGAIVDQPGLASCTAIDGQGNRPYVAMLMRISVR
ncbi:MAG TPA: hypothetical protein VMF65_19750 [Acidimicrobiales bacterium]|nr:hypothetical protein [Acidimicrobiales bacterium]